MIVFSIINSLSVFKSDIRFSKIYENLLTFFYSSIFILVLIYVMSIGMEIFLLQIFSVLPDAEKVN